MREYRKKHPEKIREQRNRSMKKWREENREEHNRRNRMFRQKWAGMPEKQIHNLIDNLNDKLISLDKMRPDFYDIELKIFVEAKRATTISRSSWKAASKYFPGLYFYRTREHTGTPTLDEQIEKYPKPLLILLFDGLTGKYLHSTLFTNNDEILYNYDYTISYPSKMPPNHNNSVI